MRISDWSSDVCSSDLAISKGNGASGAFAILTELKRRLAEIAQAKALTSQLSAGVFCDQLDVDGAGLARQAELGSPHKAWQYRVARHGLRSEEHTSELQSLMRISYAVFCLKKKQQN